jgi:hypothetical protein
MGKNKKKSKKVKAEVPVTQAPAEGGPTTNEIEVESPIVEVAVQSAPAVPVTAPAPTMKPSASVQLSFEAAAFEVEARLINPGELIYDRGSIALDNYGGDIGIPEKVDNKVNKILFILLMIHA